jgi:hypothetical protein
MAKVYSMGGIERVVDGDTVRVSAGEHTAGGYVPRKSITVTARPSIRLSAARFGDLLASAMGQAVARREPCTPEWAAAVRDEICRRHAADRHDYPIEGAQ